MICARDRAKKPKNFVARNIKTTDVKTLYAELQTKMSELPLNSKDFCGFRLHQLNTACRHLNVNAFIFDCELTDGGFKGSPGCLQWRSDFVEGAHESICCVMKII